MRPRNLVLLLAGVTVALVTLLVSWRFGVVFFLLPLFFVWSWGGGEPTAGGGTHVERSGRRAEGGGEGQPGRDGDERAGRRGEEQAGRRGEEQAGRRGHGGERGLDGEGI